MKTCQTCGKSFQIKYPNNPNKFCSIDCMAAANRRRVTLVCAECGREYEERLSKVKEGRKYCSRACWRKNARLTDEQYKAWADRMSVIRRGSGNPAFKHGRFGNQPRRSKFSLALKGEDRCRNCGSTWLVQLHHTIPRSLCRAARDELLNGLPLCASCHESWHKRGKVTIYRDVFRPDEWAYLCSVKLTGQNIMPWLDERYPERLAGVGPMRRREEIVQEIRWRYENEGASQTQLANEYGFDTGYINQIVHRRIWKELADLRASLEQERAA